MTEPAGYFNSFEMIVVTHCFPMGILKFFRHDHFIVVLALIAQTFEHFDGQVK
jgi:hypothetical protein